ncbi:Down syndrome cell adhesion molecule-like protein 1 homolog [Poecilia latipinna]|uniref:Down syndrome cell adhesion molecule-like protein 1 homolog n=1 Tax=Poecilia latipinna TaxID=48699 RepID=UPI00072E34F2|nr:PREDICTED: Down syndrome cell adhesion molecule-like protein 1 homolog [Poecilia latipinna]
MNRSGREFPAFYCLLLLCLLKGCTCQYYTTTTTVGSDVSLTCTYAIWKYDRLPFCWARGSTSAFGCNNEVLKSDGTSVKSRLSWRYDLRGNLGNGDASLTITQVQEADSGKYICRVEIPGWFNDQEVETTLNVVPGRPSPPQVELRELKQRAATVGWSPPFDGGRYISSYLIDFKRSDASWNVAVRTQDIKTQVTLVDLRPATTYNLRAFAVNSVGTSDASMGTEPTPLDASNVLAFTTQEAAPEGPPLDMRLQAVSTQSIRVTWKPPQVELRNGVLRSYTVSYRDYDALVQKWWHLTKMATGDQESILLTDLQPSTRYDVLIQARTNAGEGPAATAPLCSTLGEATTTTSTTATTRTKHTSLSVVPPDPPVIGLQEVTNYTISIFWTPGFEGNSPISGFYLEYKAQNASWDYTETVIDFDANETEATLVEFKPSTYNIRMFAKNSLGTSNASNVLTVTIEEGGVHFSSSSPGCVSLYAPKTPWDLMLIFLGYLWFFCQTSEFNLCLA